MNRLLRSRPWFGDWYAPAKPDRLTRPEFVARYLPQYVSEYEPRRGLYLRPSGRPVNSGSGARGVVTKRNARIDEAFEAYLADYAACESAGHWLPVGNPTP